MASASSAARDTAEASNVVFQLPDSPDDPTLADGGDLHTECPAYVELMREALKVSAREGFGDVEALDAFRLTGPDLEGRRVFMFIPGNIPENEHTQEIIERLTLYVLSLVHDVVVVKKESYTAIWLCNNQSDSRLTYRWFRRTYNSVPYVYHERLAVLCIVHPSLRVRLILFLLSYLPRHSFWEKINYADRLEFLDDTVPVALIKTLPKAYKEYDKELDVQMYSSDNLAHVRSLGGLGMMGSMGMGMGETQGSSVDADGNAEGPQKFAMPKRNWED